MKPLKPREPRQKVFLVARVRFDGRWSDARIWDVSRRGMMLRMIPPVPVGGEIEIVRGPVIYRGRVVWCAGDRLGVRIDETVDLEYLIGRTSQPSSESAVPATAEPKTGEPKTNEGVRPLPRRPKVIDALRLARDSASRTRSSMAGHVADTLHRFQASLGR